MRYLFLAVVCFWSFAAFCQPGKRSIPDSGSRQNVRISRITIQGNIRTRDRIILRELNVHEGSCLPADSLGAVVLVNKQRLAAIGLFTSIDISADTSHLPETELLINVRERWYIIPELAFQLADRNFNVWWTEHDRDLRRVIIGLTVRDKNFRGNLESLSITAQAGYTQKLYIDYFKPYIDKGQKHGIGLGFGFAESQETFYNTDSNKLQFIRTQDKYIIRQYEGSVSYAYRPAYASRHIVRLAYKQFDIEDTILQMNPDYYRKGSDRLKMLELSYRYELNRTDNWNYPLTGHKLIAQLFLRGGLEGLDKQAFVTLEAGRFYNPWSKWFISAIFRGRVSLPEDQPYAFRYALGTKYDYVRGYEYYVIDGSQFAVGRFNFKRELLSFNINKLPFRYLPLIPVRIYPKIFADLGYVTNKYPGNSFLNDRWLYSAGAGVDIFTAYDIKIRLEYAFNHLGQKALFLHFNSE